MKVVATRTGQFNLRRYKEGAEFSIESPAQFSAAWMKPVGAVPKEFAEVVEQRVDAFERRKTPEQIRREADEAARKTRDLSLANAISAGVVSALREQHVEQRAAAGSPAAPTGTIVPPKEPTGAGTGEGSESGAGGGKKTK